MNTSKIEILTVPLNISLKGNRHYLHGTDILHTSLQAIKNNWQNDAITDIDIRFHKMATKGLSLGLTTPKNVDITAQLTCKIGAQPYNFFLYDNSAKPGAPYPYNEEEITSNISFDLNSGTALCQHNKAYSNIEHWVAITKAMHHALLPNSLKKWLFVRGKFSIYQAHSSQNSIHRIIFESNFSNKFTRSAVWLDNHRIGDIFFSLE